LSAFSGHRIYFAADRELYQGKNLNPVQVDIIVISSGSAGLDQILRFVSPEIVVFDSTVPFIPEDGND
jgi:hypothetical protein